MNYTGLIGELVHTEALSLEQIRHIPFADSEGQGRILKAITENDPVFGQRFYTIEDAQNEALAATLDCEDYQELESHARFMQLATGDEMYNDILRETVDEETGETVAERLARQGGQVDYTSLGIPF